MRTALTIGFFDGVHLGHQALLTKLLEKTHSTILTFENHPLSILAPPSPSLLISLEEKISLLKKFADVVEITPFTKEFAQTPFEKLLDRYDLSDIILGIGSVFGKDRKGTEEAVKAYGEKRNITVTYIEKTLFEGAVVSSSRIRKALAANDLDLAQKLLGRPF